MAHANSMVSLDDEETKQNIEISTDYAFTDIQPELIDEWNRVPKIWDAVRYRCDMLGAKGNFILTCSTRLSSQEEREKIFHSGAGRIARIVMRPMSLYESGESSGKVSLKRLLEGTQENVRVKMPTLENLSYYIVRGGWPTNLTTAREHAGN